MATGTVKWYNSTKGFGFIQPDNGGSDVFVHSTSLQRASIRTLHEGQKLSYEIAKSNGREAAANIKVVETV